MTSNDFDNLMDQVEKMSKGFESLEVEMVMFICDVKKSKLMQMCCGTTHAVRFVQESQIGASFLSEFLDFSQGFHVKKKQVDPPQKKATSNLREEGIGLEMSVDEVVNQDNGNRSHDQSIAPVKEKTCDVSQNIEQGKELSWEDKFTGFIKRNKEKEGAMQSGSRSYRKGLKEGNKNTPSGNTKDSENQEENTEDFLIEIKKEPIDPDDVDESAEFYESNIEQSNQSEYEHEQFSSEQSPVIREQFKTEPEDIDDADTYDVNETSTMDKNTQNLILTRSESFNPSLVSNGWTNILDKSHDPTCGVVMDTDIPLSNYGVLNRVGNSQDGEQMYLFGKNVDGENGDGPGDFQTFTTENRNRSAERSFKWGVNMLQDEDFIKSTAGGRCKRGKYAFYSPELKATIARYALDNGACKAARYFTQRIGKRISESTVRSFKNAYLLQKKMADVDILEELTPKRRGKPKHLELVTMEQPTVQAEVDEGSGDKSDNGETCPEMDSAKNLTESNETCSETDAAKSLPESKRVKLEDDSDHTESMDTLESHTELSVDEVNSSVGQQFVKTKISRRKRGKYALYTPEEKAKIARFAIENGTSRAARHFTERLGKKISESTVRSFKNAYMVRKKMADVDVVEELIPKRRGKPKLLGEALDNEVCSYLKDLREAGGVVNSSIVQSIGRGVILDTDHTLLKENGGYIDISREWARSILRRLNFIKRKPTKGVSELPQDFDQIKSKFLERINQVRSENDIPADLVINWGQAGLNLVPVSDWTTNDNESLQSPILNPEDRRQVTAVFACTLSGNLLAPQLIYQGKTELCHPKVDFPDDWNITHTDTRWTTESTMIEYVTKVIVPYVEDIRYSLGVDSKQTALAVFEILLAHRSEKLLEILREANIRVLFVPASCTDQLHPISQMPIKIFKEELKLYFQNWYAEEVSKQMQNKQHGDKSSSVRIDIKTTTLKPMHAEWVIQVFNKLHSEKDLFIHAFNSIGIF